MSDLEIMLWITIPILGLALGGLLGTRYNINRIKEQQNDKGVKHD